MIRDAAIALVVAERERQVKLWDRRHDWGKGDCSSLLVQPIVKVAVLTEECGEVARAVLDMSPVDDLRDELAQVAAICVAWLESL